MFHDKQLIIPQKNQRTEQGEIYPALSFFRE